MRTSSAVHGKVSPKPQKVYKAHVKHKSKVKIHVPRVCRAAGAGAGGDPDRTWQADLRRTKQPPNKAERPGESIAVRDAFHRRPAVQPGRKTAVVRSGL
jgi:hypothetical protein